MAVLGKVKVSQYIVGGRSMFTCHMKVSKLPKLFRVLFWWVRT